MDTKEAILRAAVLMALKSPHGYIGIRREQIAEMVGCSTGLVNKHFDTMDHLRNEVLKRAVRDGFLRIIAQAVVLGDKNLKAPRRLVNEALREFLV